jgi:hypothetical protein
MISNLDPDLNPELDPEGLPRPLSPLAVPRAAFPLLAFPLIADRFYASLIRHAPSAVAGLGGRLLYVGELDDHSRALMVAANIAGAASLAATADHVAQKQSIHDGVADFLVNSLDEALRILKNEIRKREPVAVCVSASPKVIEEEMLERGVLPDMVRDLVAHTSSGPVPDLSREMDPNLSLNRSVAGTSALPCPALIFGGRPILVAPVPPEHHESILAWSLDQAPAKWLPRLDAIAIECLGADESPSAQIARRWLRIAPRYLGRLATNVRVLRCPASTAKDIANRFRASVQSGEIAVPVRIEFV